MKRTLDETLKAGFMIVYAIVVFIGFFHLFRRVTLRVWVMIACSAGLAFLLVLPFYGFSPVVYLEETRVLFLSVFSGKVPELILGAVLATTVILLSVPIYREARLSLWGEWVPSKISKHEYRPLGQVLGGLLIAYFVWVSLDVSFLFVSVVMAALILLEYSRLNPLPTKPLLRGAAERWIGTAVQRPGERMLYVASFFFLAGVIAVILLLPEFALPSILVATLADPFGLIGREYGKSMLIYNPEKTLEGSLTFFGVALGILLMLGIEPWKALAAAFGAMMVESICALGTDNLATPIATGGALALLA